MSDHDDDDDGSLVCVITAAASASGSFVMDVRVMWEGMTKKDHPSGICPPRYTPTHPPIRILPYLLPPPPRPGYLLANFSGPAKYRAVRNSHFDPYAALFTPRQAPLVALSVCGLLVAVAALVWAAAAFGPLAVAAYYGVPYLVVNAHLVLITYLQHTDTFVPHYREAEFTWLRGALSTVDRSFGAWLDDALHHIVDSHVVHHLFHTVRGEGGSRCVWHLAANECVRKWRGRAGMERALTAPPPPPLPPPQMPFYNAVKATPYVKAVLGDYYLSDDTPVLTALFRSWRTCKFVDPVGGIVYYRSAAEFNATGGGPGGKKVL